MVESITLQRFQPLSSGFYAIPDSKCNDQRLNTTHYSGFCYEQTHF